MQKLLLIFRHVRDVVDWVLTAIAATRRNVVVGCQKALSKRLRRLSTCHIAREVKLSVFYSESLIINASISAHSNNYRNIKYSFDGEFQYI